MSVEDVWKSTTEVLRERMTSPVVGPFACSWLGWNYKFVLLLFSDVGIPKIFWMIEGLYPATAPFYAGRGLLYPALTTAAYIVFMPWLEVGALMLSGKVQKQVRVLKQDVSMSQLLEKKEGDALREENDRLRLSIRTLNERSKNEIESLQGQLDAAAKELAKPGPTPKVGTSELSSQEFRVLEHLQMFDAAITSEDLVAALPLPAEDVLEAVEQLRQRGMTATVRVNEVPTIRLTEIGRRQQINRAQPQHGPATKVEPARIPAVLLSISTDAHAGLRVLGKSGGAVSRSDFLGGTQGRERIRREAAVDELTNGSFVVDLGSSLELTAKGRSAALAALDLEQAADPEQKRTS
jgi:cell division protein FtsB